MKTPELPPCPVCGQAVTVSAWHRTSEPKTMYQVLCYNRACKSRPGTTFHANQDNAVEEWNRRVTDENILTVSAIEDAVERLKKGGNGRENA